jgi:hypothetical protein
MAKGARISTKRILIGKANSTIVVAVGVAAFVTAFSLVSAKSLLAKRSYQARVISAQEMARDQLKANIEAVDDLKVSYQAFVGRPENIIGGSATGNGDRDGDNAKIVLDALPSVYDFPALATSIEKILVDRNYRITTINGTDDETFQNPSAGSDTSADPSQSVTTTTDSTQAQVGSAVEMPFQLGAQGSYGSVINLVSVLQSSIRPIYVQRLSFTAGQDKGIQIIIEGKSYFQPEKTLKIDTEVVQ